MMVFTDICNLENDCEGPIFFFHVTNTFPTELMNPEQPHDAYGYSYNRLIIVSTTISTVNERKGFSKESE